MSGCRVCPLECGADRQKAAGMCGGGDKIRIAKYSVHGYEEPPISGTRGSGTVFFCGCSLKCVFCQNYPVSRNQVGKEISVSVLADIFSELESRGVHNLNLVNPTHYSRQIAEAIKIAKPKIPVVWNTHGYEKLETLAEIDPLVDIYLTDFKFFSPAVSARYTSRSDYFEVALPALKFMLNSKKTELSDGLMKSGVIVRHLVLPLSSGDSINVLRAVRPLMKGGAYLSLMSQYTPFGEISDFPELKRKITPREYRRVLDEVYSLDFENAFIQDPDSSAEAYIPTWDY